MLAAGGRSARQPPGKLRRAQRDDFLETSAQYES
jgi:hypothetical protein